MPSTSISDFSPSNDMIWYSDGSVILVVEKTAFRVHASILAAQCEVFKGMLGIPQPAPDAETGGAEMYEGCPVVRMQDSAVDLTHFLKSIYDFQYFQSGVKSKFPIVAAVLRLSTKYHAPALRHRAISFLSTAYPSTLAAWDKRSIQRLIPPFEDEFCAYVALATETDVRAILPGLYYAAARKPLGQIIPLLRTLAIAPAVQWDVCSDFVLGRERLFQVEIKHILTFLNVEFKHPGCQHSSCATILNNTARLALRKATEAEAYHQWCSANASEVGRSLALCQPCSTTVENSIKDARNVVWEQLPGLFGLPDWETLKARDELDVE
ncbi:hypothetical protein BKA93DRAFT_723844 [Sparassis latifolia]